MITSQYIGGEKYLIYISDKKIELSSEEINQLTSHNFKNNSVGESNEALEYKIEDLEYETGEEIDFAIEALSDISEKIMKVQRRLDTLNDEVEKTDKELFNTLSDIGDELNKVNEFTLDMKSSVKG